jgi:hypothetical protein
MRHDVPARGFNVEQDREIAEKRGFPSAPIKSQCRSGAKTKERVRYGWVRTGVRISPSAPAQSLILR